jgi:hypothetical protein
MTDLDSLIDQLAKRARPVRPIATPLQRTLGWSRAALALVAVLAASMGLRPGLATHMAQAPVLLEWLASVLTGLLAAYAVFQISVPGRSLSWAWLPALPFAVWLASIGWGCARDFASLGMAAFAFESHSGECARAIAAISVPLGVTLLVMVRHAGAVKPGPTAMLAALSAAALASAGVSLVHAGETSLMVLLWHVGAVAVLSLACLLSGQRLFAWLGPQRG